MFDFLKRSDPVEKAAKQWASMLVKWQRDNPGRPVSECMAKVRPLMQHLYKEGSGIETVDALFAGKTSSDLREVCIAFVQLQTQADRARVEPAVDRALFHARA